MKSGQVALIVMIVSAVMMTLGLSISRRATVEIRVDSDEESLKQAFNVAESGIENYLKNGETTFQSGDGKSTAEVLTNNIGGGSTLNYSEYTTINSPVYYWLRDHNSDGSINLGTGFDGTDLRVCVDDGYTGTLKVDYFYRTAGGVYGVWRSGYNFGTLNTVGGYSDSSGVASGSCVGRSGAKEVQLIGAPLSGNVPILLTVRPIFIGTRVSIRTATVGEIFPYQGETISSIGKVENVGAGAGGGSSSGSSQVVRVNTGYSVPGFMLEAINSDDSVLSN